MELWEMPAETAGIEHALNALRNRLLAHGARRLPDGSVLIEDTGKAAYKMAEVLIDFEWEFIQGHPFQACEALLRAAEGRET